MYKSQLIQVLRSCSKKERRDLRKWLQSPIHNQRTDVVVLLDYLTENNHLDQEIALEKEKVYATLFSTGDYEDTKMRQTMYFLLKSLEAFLIYQEQSKDTVKAELKLASIYRHRKLDKSFRQTMSALQETHTQSEFRNENYLFDDFKIQQELYYKIENEKRGINMNLQEISDTLDVYFIAEKLKIACLMYAHKNVYKKVYTTPLLKEIIEFIENEALQDKNISIAIYYNGYKMLSEVESESYFQTLKGLIQEKIRVFLDAEKKIIYLMALNYCISQVNAANKRFFTEMFELYKSGLEKRIFLEDNILSRWTFRNIIVTALNLKEFDWTEKFIDQYKGYIEDTYREHAVSFNLAKLYFEKGDYKASMRLLSQTEYDDVLINLNAKTMLLKMFYMLGEFDSLESLVDSMRTYLQRKDMISYHKNNYKNIVSLVKKLLNLNTNSKTQIEKFTKAVEETTPNTEKNWFLERIAKL